ncbi:MAG: SDR family oxidoreductase [Cyclobacteriaceae bacterium]|nr:SDR family oxidoreductase [Cyclobacteriaceae bacterium]
MNLQLHGKRALVCGSSQGLGLASAIELSQLGAEVTLVSRNAEKLQQALSKLNAVDSKGHDYVVADFSQPTEALDILGGKIKEKEGYHVLINNAGGPPAGNVMGLEVEDYQQGFDMHFHMVHELSKMMVPGMKAAGFGRIVNILSVSVKQPIDELPVSNMIRAGIANWAKTLSNEISKYGITVNNVLPGMTETERLDYLFEKRAEMAGTSVEEIKKRLSASVPAGRLGRPEELGAVVAFLCSPAAAYVTGICVPVDGGSTRIAF